MLFITWMYESSQDLFNKNIWKLKNMVKEKKSSNCWKVRSKICATIETWFGTIRAAGKGGANFNTLSTYRCFIYNNINI